MSERADLLREEHSMTTYSEPASGFKGLPLSDITLSASAMFDKLPGSSDHEKAIYLLSMCGKSYRAVARILKINRMTVIRVMQNLEE